MPRYTFGPIKMDWEVEAPPLPGDAPVSFKSIESIHGIEVVTLAIGARRPIDHLPQRIFTVYAPAPPGPGIQPQDFISAGPNGLVTVPADMPLEGGDVVVHVDGVVPGRYVVATILEFAQ